MIAQKAKRMDSHNKTQYSLPLPLDIKILRKENSNLYSLHQELTNEKPTDFEFLTKEFIKLHLNQYTKENPNTDLNLSRVEDFFYSICDDLEKFDYFDLKPEYERRIKESFGRECLYNNEASTLAHIISEKKQQCFSGTALDLIIRRFLSNAKDYSQENHVLILEKGHILPGKIIKDTKALNTKKNRFRLIGIETVITGKAIKDYGSTMDIDSSKLLVIDAEYYLLGQIFKCYLKKNSGFREAVVKLSAHKYEIPITEPLAFQRKDVKRYYDRTKNIPFNAGPWTFGSAEEIAPGDRRRDIKNFPFLRPTAEVKSQFI